MSIRKEPKKGEDQLIPVIRDINDRVTKLEKDVRRIEDTCVKIIDTQKELVAIAKGLTTKLITEEKKKNENNKDLDRLYH